MKIARLAAAGALLLACGPPARAPAAAAEVRLIDDVWVAPMAGGRVGVFEVELPPCVDAVSLPHAELRGAALEAATGPFVVVPASGPLLAAKRKEGRVLFGWLPDPPLAPFAVSGTCNGAPSFIATARAHASHAPEIGLPFAAGRWKAFNGPSATSGHRRVVLRVEGAGQARVMERFGIDWARAEDEPRMLAGEADNHAYASYGTPVLAVADGVVVAAVDGIPENTEGPSARAVPITEETIGGNYVAHSIAGAEAVAFYAHFQPGSSKVKRGDVVHAGDVLGLLGNSGNSTSPHLHFHVASSTGGDFAPLRGSSVPYVVRGLGVLPGEDQIIDAESVRATTPSR